jgi:hypothetical protein
MMYSFVYKMIKKTRKLDSEQLAPFPFRQHCRAGKLGQSKLRYSESCYFHYHGHKEIHTRGLSETFTASLTETFTASLTESLTGNH